MSGKAERHAAREAVAQYHETNLAELARHVGEAVDRFRAGELDAFEVDEVIFQYSRAAKELWKFCNLGDVQITAAWITGGASWSDDDDAPIDWWERGVPRRRRS